MKKKAFALLAGMLVLAAGAYNYSSILHNSFQKGKPLLAMKSQKVGEMLPESSNAEHSNKSLIQTISHTGNKSLHTVNAGSSTNINRDIYYTNRVVIVTFHDMSDKSRSIWNISSQSFSADLQALDEHHFHVISNRQFINWLNHRVAVPPNAVLLTFDDGYKSMYAKALPILLKYHMTGTFFDIVSRQDTQSPGFMSWGDLKGMVRNGMSVESHTYDLHYEVDKSGEEIPAFDTPIVVNGKKETAHQYFMRDYKDFFKARYELQMHLGEYINEFAYPYGWGIRTPLTALKETGYHFIFTTTPGDVTPRTNPDAIPRIDIGYSSMSPEQAIQDILQVAGVHTKQPSVA